MIETKSFLSLFPVRLYFYDNQNVPQRMPSGEIVEVKVKPYLKDYFINLYSENGKEPIVASTANKLFPFLSQYLTYRPKGWKPPVSEQDNLLFELPYSDRFNVKSLNYISPKHFREIRSFLYGMFWGDFVTYMNEKVNHKKWQKKYAIIRFMDDNNMSWDKVDMETLKKIYYRYQFNVKKTKKISR
ncbi:MAG: hypothetical protein ACLFPH_11115 [Bacteroidales bacterium]